MDFKKNSVPSNNLHFLPCKINTDDYAPVSTFFDPLINQSKDHENLYTSSFRGKDFKGKIINHEIQYVNIDKNEKNGSTLNITDSRTFKNAYIWEFNKIPSSDNTLVDIKGLLNKLKILN